MSLSRCAATVVMLLVLGACGAQDQDPTVILVDYLFNAQLVSADNPAPVLDGTRDHLLELGWDKPSRRGTWLRGPKARARLVLMGRDLQLDFVSATHPELSARGQGASLRLNGTRIARIDLPDGWTPVQISVPLPDSLVRQGSNLLEIVPDEYFTAGKRAGRALFMKRLTISARADAETRALLDRLRGEEEVDTEYALRRLGRLEPVVAPRPRPDVLVILLDAARADHLGCYGYPRDTTPFMDSMAADGIRFEGVIAPAPYTLCSVPTILTGRHWREHGILRFGDRLGDDLPTLAGMLGGAGYFTTGFSENPVISSITGLDRGFDTFTPCWGQDLQSGEAPVAQVLGALEQFPPDRPVFCYVHLMTPHAPYDPPAGHDRFTDPAYTGPADGSMEYLTDINAGHRAWTPQDRDHLVDLYDGQLHGADAGVRTLVEAWRASGRSRELLTVVLSGHGEAFGEHGRFGHKSTLYDEMLKVPLIFHPSELAGHLPAPGRMRGLEDVTPMLLRCLGIPLDDSRTWPRHFLDVYSGRDRSRRHILVRSQDEAEFGLRTPSFLVSYRTRDDQELYILNHDATQQANRRYQQPLRYLELISTARRLRENVRP